MAVGGGLVPTGPGRASLVFTPLLVNTSPLLLARPCTKAWMGCFSQSHPFHPMNIERGQRAIEAMWLLNRGMEAQTLTWLTPKPRLCSTRMPGVTGLLRGGHLPPRDSADI